MFNEIKTQEKLNEILKKIAEIDTKVSLVDKLIREKQKTQKTEENKAK